jgi:uncharacterized protein (DUF2336 family)
MSAIQEVINQLEGSLQSSSSSERLQILRSVTDLYLGGADTHSEENIELFDQVLNQLIDYVSMQALARLSFQLAPFAAAPVRVVQRLARHDDIEVSAPILRESKRLGPADLIEVAYTKSQAHLAAIAGRSEVEEEVTDVLVAKGDTDVAKIVAGNAGARFSDDGFSTLVTRAEKEVGIAELVATRSEMSPRHFKQLVGQATDAVRRRLMSISDPRVHAKITKVIAQIARDVDRAGSGPGRDYTTAQTLVYSLQEDPAVLRAHLAEFAAAGKFEETVVSLSVLGELTLGVVEKLMCNRDNGGVFLLCKAIGLDWPTARAVLTLCMNGVHAAAATGAPARFEALNLSTARRVLRFWQVRSSVGGSESD